MNKGEKENRKVFKRVKIRSLETIDKRVANALIENFALQLVADGTLKENEVNDRYTIYKKIREFLDSGRDIKFINNYVENLEIEAGIFYKKKDFHFGKIFYAMFFEHTINRIIVNECERKQIGVKMTNEIIRGINIGGKFTWLLALLELKPIKKEYLDIINKVSEERNSIVHYKWNQRWSEDEQADEKKELEFQKEIKRAIKIFKHYESLVLYKKTMAKVKKAVNAKPIKK